MSRPLVTNFSDKCNKLSKLSAHSIVDIIWNNFGQKQFVKYKSKNFKYKKSSVKYKNTNLKYEKWRV